MVSRTNGAWYQRHLPRCASYDPSTCNTTSRGGVQRATCGQDVSVPDTQIRPMSTARGRSARGADHPLPAVAKQSSFQTGMSQCERTWAAQREQRIATPACNPRPILLVLQSARNLPRRARRGPWSRRMRSDATHCQRPSRPWGRPPDSRWMLHPTTLTTLAASPGVDFLSS
jgi:hypothetical protein